MLSKSLHWNFVWKFFEIFKPIKCLGQNSFWNEDLFWIPGGMEDVTCEKREKNINYSSNYSNAPVVHIKIYNKMKLTKNNNNCILPDDYHPKLIISIIKEWYCCVNCRKKLKKINCVIHFEYNRFGSGLIQHTLPATS